MRKLLNNIYVRGVLITMAALSVSCGDTQTVEFWVFVVSMNLLVNYKDK